MNRTMRKNRPERLLVGTLGLLVLVGCDVSTDPVPALDSDLLGQVLTLGAGPAVTLAPEAMTQDCPLGGTVSREGSFGGVEEEDDLMTQSWTGTVRYDGCTVGEAGRASTIDGELFRDGEGTLRLVEERVDEDGYQVARYELVRSSSRMVGELTMEGASGTRNCDFDVVHWADLVEGEGGFEGIACGQEVQLVGPLPTSRVPVVIERRTRADA